MIKNYWKKKENMVQLPVPSVRKEIEKIGIFTRRIHFVHKNAARKQ